MRGPILAMALCGIASAAAPKIVFTKAFPHSKPEFEFVSVSKAGELLYKESATDDQPVRAKLQSADVDLLFSLAEKLNYFKSPLESGLKVANTGKKTFRYEDESGAGSEQVFNYSIDENAKQLLDRLELIAESERAYLDLDRTVHFDKLGVNDALAEIESLWLRKELAAPSQFLPLLNRIATHETFMHIARDRAARLRDQFQAVASASAEQNPQ